MQDNLLCKKKKNQEVSGDWFALAITAAFS